MSLVLFGSGVKRREISPTRGGVVQFRFVDASICICRRTLMIRVAAMCFVERGVCESAMKEQYKQ